MPRTVSANFQTHLAGEVLTLALNDTLTAYAGCDRRRDSCKAPALGGRFDNVVNYRGAPDLPGQDSILVIPSNLAWTEY